MFKLVTVSSLYGASEQRIDSHLPRELLIDWDSNPQPLHQEKNRNKQQWNAGQARAHSMPCCAYIAHSMPCCAYTAHGMPCCACTAHSMPCCAYTEVTSQHSLVDWKDASDIQWRRPTESQCTRGALHWVGRRKRLMVACRAGRVCLSKTPKDMLLPPPGLVGRQ